MAEQFLTARALAAMLSTTQAKAAAIMAAQGVHPIDIGLGTYNRRRWLASAVQAAMQEMHRAAQPAPKERRKSAPRPVIPATRLAGLSIADLHQLTTARNVQ